MEGQTGKKIPEDSEKNAGIEPEEPAMSMSFCYTLGGNARALEKFASMTGEEKRQVLEAARSARSKEEIRGLVRDVAEL